MTTAKIIVTMLGTVGIAWVNYYFVLAARGERPRRGDDR